MMRVGLLGGTFDPIHFGHLLIAERAREALALDEVWFLPAQNPPHKLDRIISPAAQRVEMLKLAIVGNERFVVSDADLQSEEPSYTATLVKTLAGAHPDIRFWFIAGADSLRDFHTWHTPEVILQHVRLAIADRPGIDVSDHDLDAVPRLRERTDRFTSPLMELSSTDIRSRVAVGDSIKYMTPDAVTDFIHAERMYLRQS